MGRAGPSERREQGREGLPSQRERAAFHCPGADAVHIHCHSACGCFSCDSVRLNTNSFVSAAMSGGRTGALRGWLPLPLRPLCLLFLPRLPELRLLFSVSAFALDGLDFTGSRGMRRSGSVSSASGSCARGSFLRCCGFFSAGRFFGAAKHCNRKSTTGKKSKCASSRRCFGGNYD